MYPLSIQYLGYLDGAYVVWMSYGNEPWTEEFTEAREALNFYASQLKFAAIAD